MVKIFLNNLTKIYDEASKTLTVLNGVNSVFDCASTAIIGRSGLGKSTLLHLMGGLDRPTSGEVLHGDVNLMALSTDQLARYRRDHVGFIFQFHQLLPEFTAVENVAMPLLLGQCSEEGAQRKASEMLKAVGLADRLDHLPGELSGGEQQRVAIARSLISEPNILLADEPTGNLDSQTAQNVQEVLKGLCRELGSTLIVVTHSSELASGMDAIYEMQPGGTLVIKHGS